MMQKNIQDIFAKHQGEEAASKQQQKKVCRE